MRTTATSPPVPAASLRGRLALAWLALAWEAIWPALWPASFIAGAFFALALFDLPALLPATLHAALLALFAVAFLVALYRGFRDFRLPGRAAARRRIEIASGLAHRPLALFEDHLATGESDPAAAALWQAHRARMAAAVRRLKVGVPAAGLLRRDPYALRVALGLVLLVGAVDAGGDWSQRIARSLTPGFGPSAPGPGIALDIWVSPPDYTGLPPQFLTKANAQQTIAVPTGSKLLAQVHGGHYAPQLVIDGKSTKFGRIDASNYKGGAILTTGKSLAVMQDGETLGAWNIRIVPDLPPTIAFARPPSHTEEGVLRLEYRATDDYGVADVKALIRRKGDPAHATMSLDLPLPGEHLKTAEATSYHDLTPNPWAGLPVEITLEAKDAIGQVGTSPVISMRLPERIFHNPVARAIIEARKELTEHPNDRRPVAETLSDLSLRPSLFNNDVVVFLALRTAQARLMLDRESKDTVPAVQQLLWETAIRIEDGRAGISQQDLRQAMQRLQNALARNAPDPEIDRLMHELQQAIDRYLQAMAQQLQQQPQSAQDMAPIDPSRMLTPQDLARMLDRARELARTGSRQAAQQLLSELQDMLENLRMGRAGQMMGQAGQSMRDMQSLMQQQQNLLDRSFRRSRGQGQPGDAAQDAGAQDALRRMLGNLMQQLGDQGGNIPAPMARADRAMRDAARALRQGESGQAIGPQTQALDALNDAARAMANQMFGRRGNGDNGLGENLRDPFGRLEPDNGGFDDGGQLRMGKAPNDYALDKAKEILRELRRRAGEPSRPEIERQYIDRLLQQF